MKEIRTHCFDKDYITKKPAYFPLAVLLFLFGLYGLYYGVYEMTRSYEEAVEAYGFEGWFLGNFENRLFPIIIFVITTILLMISIKRKNSHTHVFVRNFLIEHIESKDVHLLSEITRISYVFSKVEKTYKERPKFLFNLGNIKDYVHVKSASNEKLKRLKVNLSLSTGGAIGGNSYVSTMPNFGSFSMSQLNSVHVNTTERRSGGGFLSFILVIFKDDEYKQIYACRDQVEALLKKRFPHISDE